MRIDLSKDLEIPPGDTTQPIMNAGFHRCETGHVGILDDLILGDNTNRPAGKAPGDAAVVVDPLGNEFRLAAENPVSSLSVEDAEPLVKPSLAGKNVDELLQDIHRPLTAGISNRSVFRCHFVPVSVRNQRAKLSPLYMEVFSMPRFHCKQKYRRSLPPVKRFKKWYKFIGLKKAFPEIPPILPFSKGGELFPPVSMPPFSSSA
jgi:hypothetical protein